MCVLASAVDIVILTHREAVISSSWSPPRFVLGQLGKAFIGSYKGDCIVSGGVSTLIYTSHSVGDLEGS